MMKYTLLIAFMAFVLGTARADIGFPTTTCHILSIGIDYNNQDYALSTGVNDALAISTAFETLCDDTVNYELIEEDATFSNILSQLASLRNIQNSAKNIVILYFSGIAVLEDDTFALWAYDSPWEQDNHSDELFKGALLAQTLLETWAELPVASMLIIDACYAGQFLQQAQDIAIDNAHTKVMLLSSQPQEFSTASFAEENSFFTHTFLVSLEHISETSTPRVLREEPAQVFWNMIQNTLENRSQVDYGDKENRHFDTDAGREQHFAYFFQASNLYHNVINSTPRNYYR